MFKKIILVTALSILFVNVFGQKITIKEEKISDMVQSSLYQTKAVGYLFKVGDGEYESVGYQGENIEAFLRKDVEAYKEFEKFQRKANGAKIFTGISIASPFALLLSLDFYNDTDEELLRKSMIASVVYVGSIITSSVLYNKAPKHLLNAVEIYNRNLE